MPTNSIKALKTTLYIYMLHCMAAVIYVKNRIMKYTQMIN